jgi:predicted DCC family thiol-disulfide oxidoreductase YuxK
MNRIVLALDREGCFVFAALQSELARRILLRHGRNPFPLETFYVVTDHGSPEERLLARSEAALALARALSWPWRALAFLAAIPRPILDSLYDIVARNRYRLFGTAASCPLPSPEACARFIDGSG